MKNFTSCFKEKKFLQFFFKRLRTNKTGRFQLDFPYVSLCGPELNYTRCDDLPIVFTHIIKPTNEEPLLLSYNHADTLLTYPFEPENIYMLPETGRVYHPAMDKVDGVGLIRSKLAVELSNLFLFEHSVDVPTHIKWDGKKLALSNKLDMILKNRK